MLQVSTELSPRHLEWRNHDEVRKWCRRSLPISEREMKSWIEKIERDPSILYFGLTLFGEGIGSIGFTHLDYLNQTAEFNIFISPSFHGKGYGKRGLIELLKIGFKTLNLRLIWGEVLEGNPALDVFLKVGFQIDGQLRDRYVKENQLISATMVSLTRSDAQSQPWWG